jgi:hypothetical protein
MEFELGRIRLGKLWLSLIVALQITESALRICLQGRLQAE